MSKVVTFSVAVVLLVGSRAFGQIGGFSQINEGQVGLMNAVDLMHGHNAGVSQQNLCLDASQYSDPECEGMGTQGLLGNFVQVGRAEGECALIGVAQELAAAGSQAQDVGECVDAKFEAQTLELQAGQGIVKSAGPGAAQAQHVVVLQENQYAQNSAGQMQEQANVVGLQNSALQGGAGATGTVQAQMGVTVLQSQSG